MFALTSIASALLCFVSAGTNVEMFLSLAQLEMVMFGLVWNSQ